MEYERSGVLHGFGLWVGIVFPAAVIAFELATGMCAGALFDPLPTPGHFLLVASVPLINFLLWYAVRREAAPRAWLIVAAGAAMAIGASYVLLLFPVLPLSLLAIIFFGIGLLPFAPVLALAYTIHWTAELASRTSRAPLKVAGGAVLGLVALAAVDMPATTAHLALQSYRDDARAQASAVWTMRNFGDRNVLLGLAYGETGRATGLISFLVTGWNRGFDGRLRENNSQDARELYYRVTGKPFNARPAPRGGLSNRARWFDWDGDQGGEAVGRRIDGLALVGSRIDGSIASADNLGYFEWTFEVSNTAPIEHEARFTLALPEGAVASRATLWVNGEPREASVAGRGAARAAYNQVVNVQRRDPLLVTTDGAQRLLVQAFPINPGTTMKLRVGFTAPFAIAQDGTRSLALPAIVERNFDIGLDLRHSVWIEGDAMLAAGGSALQPGGAGNGLHGEPTDLDLLERRPRILAARLVVPSMRTGSIPARDRLPPIGVTQTIAPAPAARSGPLAIVLDGSAGTAAAGKALRETLGAIPPGLPVSLLIAGETPVRVDAAPWSPQQQARVAKAIADAGFGGGQDNIAALADAIAALAGRGTILWIHGPQPVDFDRSRARLEQLLERSTALPRLVRYQPEPGRAFTINGVPWFETAREVTPSDNLRRDLHAILQEIGSGPRWTVTRAQVPATGSEGSAHIVRLWGAAQIAAAAPKERDAALVLANRLNLVTPISGAVVLENDKAVKDNNLPIPAAADVPTVPEPHEWALLAVLAAMLAWLFRDRLRFPRLARLRTAH